MRDKYNITCNQTYSDRIHYQTLRAMATWKELGEAKRDSVNALIPKAWLLPAPLPPPTKQRDVTGKYIQQFLTPREVEITETDAVGIVKNTTTATWKAREVAEAFCHRAALAHQMVWDSIVAESKCMLTIHRYIAFMRYSLRLPSIMLSCWMNIMLSMVSPLARFTVCPLV
jgi:hypothetical protein